jgi:hypothetical protein
VSTCPVTLIDRLLSVLCSRGRSQRSLLEVAADQEVMELVELEAPPPINECVGHYIIRERDGDREGLVESVNRKTGMMIVIYEQGAAEDADDEVEVLYSEPGLVWLEEVKTGSERAAKEEETAGEIRGRYYCGLHVVATSDVISHVFSL